MYPPLQHRTEGFYCPKIPVLQLFILLLLPSDPWQSLISTVSIVLPFPECHMVGTIQHVAPSDWLLTFANMLSVSHGSIALFLLITDYVPLYGCMTFCYTH